MDIRRFIAILVGVILISFGIGIYSLRYYDNFTFENLKNNGIDGDGRNFLNVRSKDSNVQIGTNGIQVKDGDDYVSIAWDGINVKGGDDKVSIGWDGIKVKDGDKEVHSTSNIGSWFGITTKNLATHNIDEEQFASIEGINSIKIESSFIDIKVTQGNRNDIWIKYHGKMKSNVVPRLETEKNGRILNIKLTSDKKSYTFSQSNVVLEVIIPEVYDKDIDIVSSSSDIFINDVVGTDFSVVSSSGDIDLRNILVKNSKVITSSGDINIEKLEADANISSSSGDIELAVGNSGDMKITTSSGNVNVSYYEDANYNVYGNTSSGNVRSSRSISVIKDKSSRFEFNVGNGEKDMKITTSSGNIYFK